MAVEARYLSLFPPPQLLGNREMNGIEGNGNLYATPMGYGLPPVSGTTTETPIPMYNSLVTDSIQAKTSMKSDSGLSYALPVSRKRSRDSISFPIAQNQNRCGSFTFLGEDISLQIQQQQLEIDQFIAQHTDKVRFEIEERRKRYSTRIIAAVEDGMMKKLRAKQDDIDKIEKLNWGLEEKVKSLCIENQIWRDLAHSKEATANALRSNLEQVLAQVEEEQVHRGGVLMDDDAESCCGSNWREEWRTVAEIKVVKDDGSNSRCKKSWRWCRKCGKEESCVLLLPCRHLCLCTVCGSSVHTCPICRSINNASVHINMSR